MASKENRRGLAGFCSLFLLVGLGCTNKPGGLQLEAHAPDHPVRPGQPIPIQLTLRSMGPLICIDPRYQFAVEVRSLNGDRLESRAFTLDDDKTHPVEYWAVNSLIDAVEYLDVADSMGRFLLVSPGEPEMRHGCISAGQLCTSGHSDAELAVGLLTSLPPGKYSARITLVPAGFNETAPLGWTVYKQAVSSEVQFTVARLAPVTSVPVCAR